MIDWRGRRHCLQNPSRIESWGAAAASLRSSGRTNASVPTHSWGFHSYGIHTFLCHPHSVWHRIPPASPQIGIFRATDHWPLITGRWPLGFPVTFVIGVGAYGLLVAGSGSSNRGSSTLPRNYPCPRSQGDSTEPS